MFEPQIIIAVVAGTLIGILIRRLWHKRVSKKEQRLREIERQAIEESRRAEKRERDAERREKKKRRHA